MIEVMLVVIAVLLYYIGRSIRGLREEPRSKFGGPLTAEQRTELAAATLRGAVGMRVELSFTTGVQDTVRVLDADDFCVLVATEKKGGGFPAGTRWVLPFKNIAEAKVLPSGGVGTAAA